MLYYSTNNNSSPVDFRQATMRGQAPDKGLYFPETIPSLEKNFIADIEHYSNEEIAFKIIHPYIGNVIPAGDLQQIVAETINFDFPLVKVEENIFSLELFHGPTLAFKDVGARFMSRCLGYFVKNNSGTYRDKITVLVATSGDTGGAVANGFYDIDGIDVVILYPAGKVSKVQELQLTTLGKNITTLEVAGTFDDCQNLVKQAFADELLNKNLLLTSANSINVARWLPQQFYYYFAYKHWDDKNNPPVISVPSGNFGNICAGLLAGRSGLPVKHFIAACNANDVVSAYLETGKYTPKKSVTTISNAMDVGNPSNFARILLLFHQQFRSLKNMMSSFSFSDEETKAFLREVYLHRKYLLDPHGAVAYGALKKYMTQHAGSRGIFLETAHPVKFYDIVEPVIGQDMPMPALINDLLKLKKQSIQMDVKYESFKHYLLSA